jgi:hypothetical protein
MAVDLRQARNFVYEHGTLWERALFAYLFQDGSAERLQHSLLCYKNADDGYGHALEHDIRCPDSHPAALEFLLGMLVQFEIPLGPLLDGTPAWLERNRLEDGSLANPPALRDYPAAPWWLEWGGQSAPDSIAGNLARLDLLTPTLRQSTAAWATEHLDVTAIRANAWLFMAYHAFDYYLSPAAGDLPDLQARREAMVDNVLACSERAEPKQYYELLHFAPTPTSPIARALPPALLARYLDHLATAQAEDGGWHDEHGLAQWRSYVTIQVLHGLRSHGREIGMPLPR